MIVGESARQEFKTDGVTFLPGALPPDSVRMAEEAFAWSVEHPGPTASPGSRARATHPPSSASRTCAIPTCPATRSTFGCCGRPRWARSSQTCGAKTRCGLCTSRCSLRKGAKTAGRRGIRTPPTSLSKETTWRSSGSPSTRCRRRTRSNFRGSHRQTLYNTSAFDPHDETIPIWEGLPRLPDIEGDRARWDIVSWAVTPGDLIVFHPAMLHGGAATHRADAGAP